jgi:hypothetical protein
MHRMGSVGDKRDYTPRRRCTNKRGPVNAWVLSCREQEPERGKSPQLLSTTALVLSPGRARAGS